MRKGKRVKQGEGNFKHLIYYLGGITLVILVTFVITFIAYNNKLKKTNRSLLSTEKIADLVPNTNEYLNQTNEYIEHVSKDIGKSIEEAIKDVEKKNETNTQREEVKIAETITPNTSNEQKKEVVVEPEVIKDPEFSIPVEGEIYRGYAKDTLIYSDTLEEWVTHYGIDIKAERTSVVKASEAGTITTIKNDPRYGLTITIEHVNGYKTVYSNLLTTEFVKEGEKVAKGQSIGTVGNSSAFEIVDEPHLHFEILKDGVNIDPKIYIQ